MTHALVDQERNINIVVLKTKTMTAEQLLKEHATTKSMVEIIQMALDMGKPEKKSKRWKPEKGGSRKRVDDITTTTILDN